MSFIFKQDDPRHQEADRAIEAAASILGDIRVVRALGTASGRYLNLLYDAYVPNLVDNRLETPEDQINETSTAIFSLGHGEVVYPSPTMATLHASQVAMLENFVSPEDKEKALIDIKQKLEAAYEEAEPIALRTVRSEAFVRPKTHSVKANVRLKHTIYEVKARPSMYPARPQSSDFRAVGLNTLHLLAHADRALTQEPILTTQIRSAEGIEEDEVSAEERKIALVSLLRRDRS